MVYVRVLVFYSIMAIGCKENTSNKAKVAEIRREQPIDIESFGISADDLQYIDLIVPEYAEVVLYHEKEPETTLFANRLIAYFFSNHASVEVHPITTIKDRPHPRHRNFSIDFIGDHRYIVRLFDPIRD